MVAELIIQLELYEISCYAAPPLRDAERRKTEELLERLEQLDVSRFST